MWSPTCSVAVNDDEEGFERQADLESGGLEVPLDAALEGVGVDSARNVDRLRAFLDGLRNVE